MIGCQHECFPVREAWLICLDLRNLIPAPTTRACLSAVITLAGGKKRRETGFESSLAAAKAQWIKQSLSVITMTFHR